MAIVNRFNAEVNKALAQYRTSQEATARSAAAIVKERQIKAE